MTENTEDNGTSQIDDEVHVEPLVPEEEIQETPFRFTITREIDGDTITEEVTEDELKAKAAACLKTDGISIGCDEGRQIRQYEGNKYWMSTHVDTKGLPDLTHSIVGNVEIARKASGLILGQLVAKVRGVFALQKKCIHEQQRTDNIPNVDYRPGERSEGDS